MKKLHVGGIVLSNYRRSWDGTEWQQFCLQIVQARHGAQNVQTVPDKVQGDAGLEFYTTDGCGFQCYAPRETSDVAKASGAMKVKASDDLDKLIQYEAVLCKVLGPTRLSRWFLLCPFLDDKKVVAHVRLRGEAIVQRGCRVLADDFEAVVQSQDDFSVEIETLRRLPLTVSKLEELEIIPDVRDVASELEIVLEDKLSRAFSPSEIENKKLAYIRAYRQRENALARLRVEHPILWDRAMKCVLSEESRLEAVGADGEVPLTMLRNSLTQIESVLRDDLSNLSRVDVTTISMGTVGDWLMRCPLDFPQGDQ